MKIRHKLSLFLFFFGFLFFIAVSLLYYFHQREFILSQSCKNLTNVAESSSHVMGVFLEEKAVLAQTIAATHNLQAGVIASNAEYETLPAETREQRITEENSRWRNAGIDDPFVQRHLTNPLAKYLIRLQKQNPNEYGEIFLTNRYGVMIATTGKLTTLAHAQKYWWLESYAEGKGKVFFDDRGFDESVKGYVLGVVVPLRVDGKIVGILKVNFNIATALKRLIESFENEDGMTVQLVRSGGLVVFEIGKTPLSTNVPEAVVDGMEKGKAGLVRTQEDGMDSFQSFAPVHFFMKGMEYGVGRSTKSIDHQKGNRGEKWFICTEKSTSRIMEGTVSIAKNFIVVGIIACLFMALLAFYMGKRISDPITNLSCITEEIGQGNLDIRVNQTHHDELGTLASSFNKMLSDLKKTTTSRDKLASEIDQRKKVENQLKESEETYRTLFTEMLDGFGLHEIILDKKGKPVDYRFLKVNPAFERLTGLLAKDIVGKTCLEILPDTESFWVERYGKVALTGESCNFSNYAQSLDKNFEVSAFRPKDNQFATIFKDTTEQVKAEKALGMSEGEIRKIEKRNQALLDNSPVCHKIVDLDFNLQFMSSAGLEALKVTESQVYGKPYPFDFYPDGFKNEMTGNLKRVKETGETVTQEASVVDVEGNELWFFSTLVPVFDDSEKLEYIVVVSAETTERREMEEQLRQSDKMNAIGQLAGGIAHDFNNQLTGILGYADMLVNDIEDKVLSTYAQNIKKGAIRASELTNQLLAFSRKGKNLSVPVNIHSIILEVVDILQHSIDKRIEIQQDFKASHATTEGDPTQIQNSILNIAINARDAMPDGGELIFETESIVLNEKSCIGDLQNLVPGDYILITVSDNGCGMDLETQKHVFEPFYTTKRIGEGTGMGLPSAYGTIYNHNGCINLKSELDHGTTFRIYLPLFEDLNTDDKKKANNKPIYGTAQILIVDDEEVVREIATAMLEELGYQVAVCNDGKEAVKYYKKSWKEIDLVLLDMIMPELGGGDTFKAMKKINPDVRALLSSGYSINGEAQSILDDGVIGFVGKPYVLLELSEKVAEALA